MIDNGIEEIDSDEKVDDGEHLVFKITYVDWYGKTCTKCVNSLSEVKTYQDRKVNWTE